MARVVVFVLFLVLVAAIVLPFWGGIEARVVYEDVVRKLDAQGGSSFHARSEDYEHGWLQSQAHTRVWTGTTPEKGFVIDHTIHHGPYPFALLLKGEVERGALAAVVDTDYTPDLPPEVEDALALKSDPLIRLRSVIELDGSSTVTVHSPEFSLDQPPFEWRGVRGQMAFRPGGSEGHGTLKALGMQARMQNVNFDVGEFDAEFESAVSESGAPLGRVQMQLAHMRVANGKPIFHVVDARYAQAYSPQEDTELIDLTIESSVEELAAGDGTYGPGETRVVFRNLDSAALKEYRDAIARAGDATEGAEMRKTVDEALAALFPALLASGPVCEIEKLTLAMPDGVFDLTGRVRLDESAASLPDSMRFAALRGNVSVEMPPRLLHAVLDRQIARFKGIEFDEAAGARIVEIAAMRTDWIEQLMAAQLIEREDRAYFIDLDYDGNQFLVNEKPFDLSSLTILMQSAMQP